MNGFCFNRYPCIDTSTSNSMGSSKKVNPVEEFVVLFTDNGSLGSSVKSPNFQTLILTMRVKIKIFHSPIKSLPENIVALFGMNKAEE